MAEAGNHVASSRGVACRFLAGALLVAAGFTHAAEPWQASQQLLVSLSGESRITLVDPTGGRTVATFPAVKGPHEITVADDGRRAYVANSGGGPSGPPGEHVTVIDLATRTAKQMSVAPHKQPHDVRVSRDGRLLWVAVAPSRAVIEIDTLTSRIVRTFDVQQDGGWFVIATPDDRQLFVPLLEGKGLVSIDRVRGTSRIVLSGGAFSGAAVSPDGREVWAIEHDARHVHILGAASGQVITQVPLDANDFGRLQFTPDGRRVLLVQGRRLVTFDAAARRQTAVLDLALEGKVIAVSKTGTRAAISHPSDDRVTIVDLARMQVTSTVPVGRVPDGVAWVDAQ